MSLFEETRYIHFLRRTQEFLSSQPEVMLMDFKDKAGKIIDDSKETIKIVVAGEFNSGKSTLINAFLRSEIMPTKVTRETVTVNRLVYGPDYLLKLHFRDRKRDPKIIPCTGKADIDKKIREQVNPQANEIKIVDVHYPDEKNLLYFSVIDTPGVNFSEKDSETTAAMLADADVIIWLTREYYQKEHQQVKKLRSQNKTLKIIGIMNYIDMLSEDDVSEQFEHIKKTSQGVFDEIFSISAKWAIEGILSENREGLYEKSQFHKFRGWLEQNILEEHNNLLLEKIKGETLTFWSLFSDDVKKEMANCQQPLKATENRSARIVLELSSILETVYRHFPKKVTALLGDNHANYTSACEMTALFVDEFSQYANSNESQKTNREKNESILTSWLPKHKAQRKAERSRKKAAGPFLNSLKKSKPIMGISPFEALKAHSVETFETELDVNHFLKNLDLLVSKCSLEFSSTCNKLRNENADYASVILLIDNWQKEIGPTDIFNAYLLGIIQQSGMSIMGYQFRKESYVKKSSLQLHAISLNSFKKNMECAVLSRSNELREATSKRLDALGSSLDHLTKLYKNLLGD